jgi:hypothetical protein
MFEWVEGSGVWKAEGQHGLIRIWEESEMGKETARIDEVDLYTLTAISCGAVGCVRRKGRASIIRPLVVKEWGVVDGCGVTLNFAAAPLSI